MKKILPLVIVLIVGLWIFNVLHKTLAERNLYNSQKVRIGMTATNVQAIMGEPQARENYCDSLNGYTYLYDNVFGSSDDIIFCFSQKNTVIYISTE